MACCAALALAGALLTVQGAAAFTSNRNKEALAPTGNWVANFDANECVLSRSYGTVADPLTLVFRKLPFDRNTRLLIIHRGTSSGKWHGKATMRLGINGTPLSRSFNALRFRATPDRLLLILLDEEDYEPIKRADTLEIKVRGQFEGTFQTPNTEAALKLLDDCNTDLVATWGMPVAEQVRLKAPPRSTKPIASYVGDSDYPKAALNKRESGNTMIRLEIDPVGKLKECNVLRTSGSKQLDEATCEIFGKRPAFEPAVDVEGKPVRGFIVTEMRWLLPM